MPCHCEKNRESHERKHERKHKKHSKKRSTKCKCKCKCKGSGSGSGSSGVLFVSNVVQDVPSTLVPVGVFVSGTAAVPVQVADWSAAGQGFRIKVTGNLNMGNAATPLVWVLSLNAATVTFCSLHFAISIPAISNLP